MSSDPLTRLKERLDQGRVAFVLGAGFSKNVCTKAPNWQSMLESGIERCVQDGICNGAWAQRQRQALTMGLRFWLTAAQEVCEALRGNNAWAAWLNDTFGRLEADRPDALKALAHLRARHSLPVLTTNYDDLLKHLRLPHEPVTWADEGGEFLRQVLAGEIDAICHLHGRWNRTESVIFGLRDYETIVRHRFVQFLQRTAPTFRSLVFVGFGQGGDDPNFSQQLEWITGDLSNTLHQHFCLVRTGERGIATGIVPVAFGAEYGDLAPFLWQLARGRPAGGGIGTPRASSIGYKQLDSQDHSLTDFVQQSEIRIASRLPSQGTCASSETSLQLGNDREIGDWSPMLNIITLATAWGPKFGGINSFNFDFTIALRKEASPATQVFCSVLSASPKDIEHAKDCGVVLIDLDKRPDQARYDKDWALAIRHKAAIDHNVDVIHHWIGHDVISGQAAVKGASLSPESKSSLIMHMAYDRYQAFKSGVGQVAKDKEREQTEIFRRADYLFANGPLLADALKDLTDRHDVTMLVPGFAEIDAKPPRGKLVALTFGRMDKESSRIKQGALAVAAFGSAVKEARARSDYSGPLKRDVQMRVVGIPEAGGEEEKALNELLEDRSERVLSQVVTKYQDDRDAHFDQIGRSSIALMVSWHEGFGLVGWEAIAAEVPLILGKDSGLYRLLEDKLPGTQAEALTRPIDVRGQDGNDEQDAFTKKDEEDVKNAVLQIAANLPRWQANAKELKRQLKEMLICTWTNTARTFYVGAGIIISPKHGENNWPNGFLPTAPTWFELYDNTNDRRCQIDWRRGKFAISLLSREHTGSPGIGANDYSLAVDVEGKVVACLQAGILRLAWLNRVDVEKLVRWPNSGIRNDVLCDAKILAVSMIADHAARIIARSSDGVLVFRASTDHPEAIELEIVEKMASEYVRAATFADDGPELLGSDSLSVIDPFVRKIKSRENFFRFKNLGCFDSAKIDERQVWAAVCEKEGGGFELSFGDFVNGVLASKNLTEGIPWSVVVTRNCRRKDIISVVYENRTIRRFSCPEILL